MKYCKFKSVDISKCVNNNIVPKRGNPLVNDEDDELENELKNMNIVEENTSKNKIYFYIFNRTTRG